MTFFLKYWKVLLVAALLAGTGKYGYECGKVVVNTEWQNEKLELATRALTLSGQVVSLQDEALKAGAKQAEKDTAAAALAAKEREQLAIKAQGIFARIDRLTRDLKAHPQYQTCVLDPETFAELNRNLK